MSAPVFKKLLKNLPLQAVCLNSEQRILLADTRFQKFLHPDLPLEGTRFEALIYPAERERWQMAWSSLLHQGTLKEDFRMGPLGEHHVLHLTKEEDAQGITFFGWMENSLLDLQKSDGRLRTLLKAMPDIVCFKDGQGRWLEANSYDLKLFELEGVDYRGKTDRELAGLSPNYREALLECERSDEAAWQSKVTTRGDETIYHPDGNRTVLDVIKVPTFFPDGTRKGLLVVGRDITQRWKAEECLKAASQAKSQFLANVSHEIRTPMNGVLGMAELLMKSELKPQQEQWLRVLKTCGDSLLQLLNDILDLSKIEAGKMQLEEVSLHLIDQIEECAEVISVQAQAKGLRFSLIIEPDIPFLCKGDPVRLRQLLMNLLGNAVKFTTQGEVQLHVRKAPDQHLLSFQIQDTGIGIPQERQTILFEPFTQVDGSTTRHFGGTGLGLAICKRIVELMQGQIGLHSKEGEGSTFWFEIPYLPLESTSIYTLKEPLPSIQIHLENTSLRQALEKRLLALGLQEKPSSKADFLFVDQNSLLHLPPLPPNRHIICLKSLSQPLLSSPKTETIDLNIPIRTCMLVQILNRVPHTQTHRESTSVQPAILLVEDNPINQMIAKGMLEHLGCKVWTAPSGEKAIQLCQNQNWDLIFMDIQMPGMDGLETAKALRNNGLLHTPIIAMTAHTQETALKACLDAGMNDHIGKPIRSKNLARSLEKWLNSSTKLLFTAQTTHLPA